MTEGEPDRKKITWHAQIRQFLRHSHLHQSSAPYSLTTKGKQDARSKGRGPHGIKLKKEFKAEVEDRGAIFQLRFPKFFRLFSYP